MLNIQNIINVQHSSNAFISDSTQTKYFKHITIFLNIPNIKTDFEHNPEFYDMIDYLKVKLVHNINIILGIYSVDWIRMYEVCWIS